MMPNEEMLLKIGAYVDGELPASEREEVESYLEQFPECQEEAELAQWLDQLAGQESAPAVTDEEWSRLKASVLTRAHEGQTETETQGEIVRDERLSPRRRLAAVLLIAALLLVGVCVGWAILSGVNEEPGRGPTPGAPVAEAEPVEHVEGHKPKVEPGTDDGSGVHLDYGEDF